MGEWGQLTRRRMLVQAAASGAAGLVAPGLAFGRSAPGRVATRLVGSIHGVADPLPAPRTAVLAGVQWDAPAHARLELRVMTANGRWGPWVTASSLGHDTDTNRSETARFGEPLWIDQAAAIQLRSQGAVRGVRVHFVSGSETGPAGVASSFPLAQPVLDTGPGQPPILARRGWAEGHAPPVALAGYGSVRMAFVHHTVNPNGYTASQVPAMLRAVYTYHRYVRGMLDIAYNFLIDAYGRIWEGRDGGIDMAVIGAHAGGYNAESTGVAILGDFDSVVPSSAALDALKRLLAWKLSLHGLPTYGRATVIVDPDSASDTPFRPGAHVSLPRVAGHRDGDLTDCPGNALYARLPAIRSHVRVLAGVPAVMDFTTPTETVVAGQAVQLTGSLGLLDGTPLAGAPVEIQRLNFHPSLAQVSTDALATAQTAGDGTWSAELALEHDTLLRAVHPAAPASVADWSLLNVSPAIELTVVSTAPLEVQGTISPPKRELTVGLYPVNQPHHAIATRGVNGLPGSFQVTFATPPPGDYLLVARSPMTKSNAAGASAPVAVTIS